MRKIAFVIISSFLSVSCYCQNIMRSFYTSQALREADESVIKLENRKGKTGLLVGKKWYAISKQKELNNSTELWYASCNSTYDSIIVYKNEVLFYYSYKLILTPAQKDTFINSTNLLHKSHASHASHYSSAK